MPFLTLPPCEKSPTSGTTSFNYQISTPSNQIFRNLSEYSSLKKKLSIESSSKSDLTESRKSGGSRGVSVLEEGSDVSAHAQTPCHGETDVIEGTTQSLLPAPEEGYPIVLFLGAELLTTIHIFKDVLIDPILSSKYNLIALDTRAYGLSIQGKLLPDRRDYKQDDQAIETLSFLSTLLSSIPGASAIPPQDANYPPSIEWESGIHLVGVSISGLTCLRMASTPNWTEMIKSVIWSSPVKELESEDIISAYQSLQEVASSRNPSIPKEIVEGVEFRWCGKSNACPKRIIRDLKKGWLAITLAEDGPEKAHAFVFSTYWSREPFPEEEAQRVQCKVNVVEGTEHLPYEEQVGLELKSKLKNCNFQHTEIKNSPWLTPVVRPNDLARIIESTISECYPSDKELNASTDSSTSLPTPRASTLRTESFNFPSYLTRTERIHLLSMFHDVVSISKDKSSSPSKSVLEQRLESMNLHSSSSKSLNSDQDHPFPENHVGLKREKAEDEDDDEEEEEESSDSDGSFASLDQDVLLSLQRGRTRAENLKDDQDPNSSRSSGFYQDLLLEESEETFYDAEW